MGLNLLNGINSVDQFILDLRIDIMAIGIPRLYDIILERVIGELRKHQILALVFDVFVVLPDIGPQVDLVVAIEAL